tara:strand:- start:201 stop:761 length:561 start_codon:yes stop_codon:yes gene_type:complete
MAEIITFNAIYDFLVSKDIKVEPPKTSTDIKERVIEGAITGLNLSAGTSNKEEGFSLIELVVVVAVLGVLSAIAIPAFQGIVFRAEVTAAMAQLRTIAAVCSTKVISGEANPTYSIPQKTSTSTKTGFQYPDSGDDGVCLSPSTGNILTAARTKDGQAVSDFDLSINVVTGEKSSARAVPSFVNWE